MADHKLFTNCGIFCGGYNITGRANAVSMALDKEIRDRSVFGVNARQKGTGLESATVAVAGFFDATLDTEYTFYGIDTPVSLFIPTLGGAAVAAGDNAIFFKALEAGFTRGAAFGSDAMFNFTATGDQLGYPVGLGKVLNPGLVPVTADDTPPAAIKEIGAVAAGQYLYGVLHVTDVSLDDSIVVTIQSDPIEAFSTATPHIAFASKTAIGSEYAVRVPGPITDTWWRARADVTVSGAPLSITFACALAIR